MSEKMKITGLNIDCLENVFEYLEFGDLLNVASSNKRLNKAANFIFVREFSKKEVFFKNIHHSRDRLLEFQNDLITISDLKTSLQFIRCFGHLVSEIKFESSAGKSRELDQHVINYINEYCSDSLTRVTIKNDLTGWKHLNKSFPKVECVNLYGCNVAVNGTLNRLFPKMDMLATDFHGGNEKPFFVKRNHFCNLRFLYILDLSSTVLCGKTIAPILRANPQIKLLYIGTKEPLLDSSDFRSTIKKLQNLETLKLRVKTLSTKCINGVIPLKRVKSFEIATKNDSITKIPFLFDQLDTLDISCDGQLHAEFFRFIDKHPTIRDLTLRVGSLSVMDRSKISESLPSLVSIDIWRCTISANEATNLMFKFENLENFYFNLSDTTDYDDFQAQLNNEWDCGFTDSGRIAVNRIGPMAKKRKLH